MYVHAHACVRKVFKCVCLCSNNKALLPLSDHRHSLVCSLSLSLSLSLYPYILFVFFIHLNPAAEAVAAILYTQKLVCILTVTRRPPLYFYISNVCRVYIYTLVRNTIYNIENTLCIYTMYTLYTHISVGMLYMICTWCTVLRQYRQTFNKPIRKLIWRPTLALCIKFVPIHYYITTALYVLHITHITAI